METWRTSDESGLVRVEFGAIAIDGVGDSRQFVAQTVVQSEFSTNLPLIENEKTITPFGHVPAHLRPRSGEGLRQAQDKISRRIASQRTVKRKRAAWTVSRLSSRSEAADFQASHDVMRAVNVTDLLGNLVSAIGLIPIRARITKARGAGSAESR